LWTIDAALVGCIAEESPPARMSDPIEDTRESLSPTVLTGDEEQEPKEDVSLKSGLVNAITTAGHAPDGEQKDGDPSRLDSESEHRSDPSAGPRRSCVSDHNSDHDSDHDRDEHGTMDNKAPNRRILSTVPQRPLRWAPPLMCLPPQLRPRLPPRLRPRLRPRQGRARDDGQWSTEQADSEHEQPDAAADGEDEDDDDEYKLVWPSGHAVGDVSGGQDVEMYNRTQPFV
jgi:hypothetical protein